MSITRTYSCLLFDLDGTLADTSEGIFNGLKYMMTKLGLKELGEDVLYSFLGPPLSESLYKAYGLTGKESDEAISAYREYYSGEGLTIYRQYPGLCDTIARLSQAGITLFVATSKPTPFAETITEDMKISSCFKDIVGSNLDNTRINKTDVIRYILDAYALEKDECLMIGDRYSDIFGARECGIDSLGVTYGFGSAGELKEAGATYLADCPESILCYAKF